MARPPAVARPARTLRKRALASGAALAVLATPVLLATPAYAAETQYAGATGAFALRLQINLPSAAAPLTIDLQVDPVTGTVSTSDNIATATAQVLGSDAGLLKTVLDAATPLKGATSANLSHPGPNASSLVPALPAPLSDILTLGLIESGSTVTPTSSGSSASVARIGLALGDQLAAALAPLTDALAGAQAQVITAISAQLPLLVGPLCDSLVDPVIAPALATLGLTSVATLVCDLPAQLTELSEDLTAAITTLGDSVFATGLIQTSQTIERDGEAIVAQATASIAGLNLLGTGPLGAAGVIQSQATAGADGTAGGADAEVIAPIVADINIGALDALADLQVTLSGLLGDLAGSPITAPLTTVLDQVLDVVNGALEPIGASVITLDDSNSAVDLASCPTALTGLQKGTFIAANGTCAAAATRGLGIEVTLPTALATPLGITGPFITLALAPTAAVAQAATAPVVTTDPEDPESGTPGTGITGPLPRTGIEGGLLGGAAIAALLGAATLRRRRMTV